MRTGLHSVCIAAGKVGGGTLLARCGDGDCNAPGSHTKVNGWGPFFANDRCIDVSCLGFLFLSLRMRMYHTTASSIISPLAGGECRQQNAAGFRGPTHPRPALHKHFNSPPRHTWLRQAFHSPECCVWQNILKRQNRKRKQAASYDGCGLEWQPAAAPALYRTAHI
jgi:hypothetical protein